MKITFYILQRHTETGQTREQLLDVQHWSEIHTGDKVTVQGQTYLVNQLRTKPNSFALDAVCLEVPHNGNPGLLKNLIM